ncbi:hypothetical protein [Streptomyces sp. NPDC059786]|uniref:hypothetical protein n=1 Tax=Streptomyces sp. NPDC059786 TaxID=3346946 RepID=UPI00364DF92E
MTKLPSTPITDLAAAVEWAGALPVPFGSDPVTAEPRRLTADYETSLRVVAAADSDDAATRVHRSHLAAVLDELDAVRAELDEQRERALDAMNREIVDGREVCADCARPVPDGPCNVHSPDAVFQRAAREAASLRAQRDRAGTELERLRRQMTVVAEFIAQRGDYEDGATDRHPDGTERRIQWLGHAAARKQLADRLADIRQDTAGVTR